MVKALNTAKKALFAENSMESKKSAITFCEILKKEETKRIIFQKNSERFFILTCPNPFRSSHSSGVVDHPFNIKEQGPFSGNFALMITIGRIHDRALIQSNANIQ